MQQKSEIGTVSAIIIVIAILLIGGFYFFGQRVEKQKQFEAERAQQQQLSASTAADVSTLDNEASSMNYDDLDSGVSNLK